MSIGAIASRASASPPLTTLDIRATSAGSGSAATLPVGTQLGDFVVLAINDISDVVTDARFTRVDDGTLFSGLWVGTVADLTSTITLSGTPDKWVCVAFSTPLTYTGVQSTSEGTTSHTTSLAMPVLSGNIALGVAWYRTTNITAGNISLPSPWVIGRASTNTNSKWRVSIYFWVDYGASSTPVSDASFTGTVVNRYATCTAILTSP